MTPKVDRVNRVVLIVLGLVLVLAGLAVLLVGGGAFGSRSAGAPIVSGVVSDNVDAISSWFWPVLAGVCLVVAVLAAWWAFAQPRTQTVARLQLERTAGGSVSVLGSSLGDCLQSDCESIAGVARARARVTEDGEAVRVTLTVWVGAPYDLQAVVRAVDNLVLPHLAWSLDREQALPLRTTVHLEATSTPVSRLA